MKTVADIMKELQALPQDLPVLVSAYYDNDNGLSDDVNIYQSKAEHSEDEFWSWSDEATSKKFVVIHG